jgi:signal peptidase I
VQVRAQASKKKFWTEGLGSFLLAVLLAFTIRWALIEAYVIPSTSMLPTLLVNDHIFVNKIVYGLRIPLTETWLLRLAEPKPGDVVVFKYPQDKSQLYIKRVVGIAGDRVFFENGNLYINEKLVERRKPQAHPEDFGWVRDEDFPGESGGRLDYVHWEETLAEEPYSVVLRKEQPAGVSYGPYTVPAGHFFVMGDNRNNSQDSREWEQQKRFVPRDYVVGRAMFVWLSCEKTFATLPFLCHPLSVRWNRIFHPVH